MYRRADQAPGYAHEPRSAGQWIEYFTQSKTIWLPRLQNQPSMVDVENIDVPAPGTNGDPDLLVTLASNKQFYVKFCNDRRIYYPLELPTLYFPVEKGAAAGFWVVKDQYALKL